MKKVVLLGLISLFGFLVVSCGGEQANVKKDANAGAERKKFIQSVEKQATEGIAKLDADIKDAMNWNLKQVRTDMKNKDTASESELKLQLVKKIRPAQTSKDEANALFAEAKKIRADFEANIDNDVLPEYESYKSKMKSTLDKISKATDELKTAMDDFKKDFKNLK